MQLIGMIKTCFTFLDVLFRSIIQHYTIIVFFIDLPSSEKGIVIPLWQTRGIWCTRTGNGYNRQKNSPYRSRGQNQKCL